MTKILAIDVDLTVLPSDIAWFEYLNKLANYPYKSFDCLPRVYGILDYNFMHYFPMLSVEQVQSFWKQTNAYDNLVPLPNVVELLSKLDSHEVQIVWVSMSDPLHQKSKEACLKREIMAYIPDMEYKFVATQHKGLINADIFIDDRLYHHAQFSDNPKCFCIWLDRKYNQLDAPKKMYKICERAIDWYEIENTFRWMGLIKSITPA